MGAFILGAATIIVVGAILVFPYDMIEKRNRKGK